jgi:dihydroneopterin aldolase/2-amino-4-hydroxy-6-hydroxymethyldihydropteridine diphosphokinase
MNSIIIKNLDVTCPPGMVPATTDSGGRCRLTAEFYLQPELQGEQSAAPMDFAPLCREIRDGFCQMRAQSIEACLEELTHRILLAYARVDHVSLTLKLCEGLAGISLDYAGVRVERGWHRAFLGVGSNLGDRHENIQAAAELINQSGLSRVESISKIYETEPQGYLDQGRFLNCAFEIKTLLSPTDLIRLLLDIEERLKRERKIHLGPRTIDLDLLFYDDLISDHETAVIPHPRLHQRRFVLTPLCDIAPYVLHPILKERCNRIAEKLDTDEPEPKLWPGKA